MSEKKWNRTRPTRMVDGVKRFIGNKIVRHLLNRSSNSSKFDLNDLASMMDEGLFSDEDYNEFMQLIEYSECGYHEIMRYPKK